MIEPKDKYSPAELQEIYTEMEKELVKTLPENKEEVFRRYARIYNLELTKVKRNPRDKTIIRKLPQLFEEYAATHRKEKHIRAK